VTLAGMRVPAAAESIEIELSEGFCSAVEATADMMSKPNVFS
jgi:hypothetical protein